MPPTLAAYGAANTPDNLNCQVGPLDCSAVDLLVAVWGGGFGGTFEDSSLNSWLDSGLDRVQTGNGSADHIRVKYVFNPTVSAAQTFTVTSNNYQAPSLAILGFSGAGSFLLDGAAVSAQGSSGTSLLVGPKSPAGAGGLIVVGLVNEVGSVPSFDSGFSATVGASGGYTIGAAHLITGSSSPVSVNGSWTGSYGSAAILIAFKPAPPSGGVPLLRASRMGAGFLDLNGGFLA